MRREIVLAIVLLLSSWISACTKPAAPQGPDPSADAQEPLGAGTIVNWTTRLTGDFVVRFNLTAAPGTQCHTSFNTSYQSTWAGPATYRRIENRTATILEDFGGSQRSLLETDVRARVGETEVHPLGDPNPRRVSYGYERRFGFPADGGDIRLTLAARDLVVFNGDPRYGEGAGLSDLSAVFLLRCGAQVQLHSFEGGHNVLFFDEMGMQGGANLHAIAVFDGTGASAAATARLNVAEPRGLLSMWAWGDLLLNRVSGGVARITYPGGTDTWVMRPANLLVDCVAAPSLLCKREDVRRSYERGAGAYEVELTYASVEQMGIVEGIMAGFAPISDLAAIEKS